MKKNLILLFLFLNGLAFSQSSKPFILGQTEEMRSVLLNENRTLNIYLPEGYKQEDSARYPVIYLLDGGADEDFIHIVGLVQFNNFPWINRVPKSIVVGIVNTDRKRDFCYPTTFEEDKKRFPTAGHSAQFISFLEKELQPFIDKKFKTSGSNTLIGQSLGGLLATEILLKKPKLFNNYIIISPSLWWDDGSLLKHDLGALEKEVLPGTGVYLGVGKEGLAPFSIPHVMEVDVNILYEKLKALKKKDLNLHSDYLPEEDHATISHQAVFNAFRMLYPLAAEK